MGQLICGLRRGRRTAWVIPACSKIWSRAAKLIGLGLIENVIKECTEEADIPAKLAAQARPTGAFSYIHEAAHGLNLAMMFCYDLPLLKDFVPRNTDGEIAAFYQLPLAEVSEIVESSFEFKINCNLVIIDFLIRHGFLPTEHPDYLRLTQDLRK